MPRTRTWVLTAAFVLVGACSQGNDVHLGTDPTPTSTTIPTTLAPAPAGTLILKDYTYSYTPIGSSPTGFRDYGGPITIHVAVGTSIIVDLTYAHDPTSSDAQIVQPDGKPTKNPDGNAITRFRAVRAGTAAISAPPPKCGKTGVCYGSFSVPLVIP